MANLSNRYFLNNKDIFDNYGLMIENGSVGFQEIPERKPSLSHDWPEENGIDIDLDDPRFNDYEVALKMAFLANSDEEYYAFKTAFRLEIMKPGWHYWRVASQSATYSVYYLKTSNWGMLEKRMDIGKVTMQFTLHLKVATDAQINVNPPSEALPVYIVDVNGNPLFTAPSGSTIQIISDFSFAPNIVQI